MGLKVTPTTGWVGGVLWTDSFFVPAIDSGVVLVRVDGACFVVRALGLEEDRVIWKATTSEG